MFSISKSFDFAYGHRVYSQNVDPVYAGSSECPCRRLHGHQGKVTVHIEAKTLDDRGFVIDFKELSFVKRFLDENIDHRFIVSLQDPGFERLVGISPEEISSVLGPRFLLPSCSCGFMGDRIKQDPNHVDDHTDSFFVVDFNPTSENLAKWIYDGLAEIIEDSGFVCHVKYVNWSETPKTGAVYKP